MKELKPCPFCGHPKAPRLSSVKDCEDCANFEDSDCPNRYEPSGTDCEIHFVVCSCLNGGCGAATGWHLNADRAVKAWNRRADNERLRID